MPMEPNFSLAQDLFMSASTLVQKWHDHLENYEHFRQRALNIVPNLIPSFEEGPSK
jgi:hypothetical protein